MPGRLEVCRRGGNTLKLINPRQSGHLSAICLNDANGGEEGKRGSGIGTKNLQDQPLTCPSTYTYRRLEYFTLFIFFLKKLVSGSNVIDFDNRD